MLREIAVLRDRVVFRQLRLQGQRKCAQTPAQFGFTSAAVSVAKFVECSPVIHDGKVRQFVAYDIVYQFFGIKKQVAGEFYVAARIAFPQYPPAGRHRKRPVLCTQPACRRIEPTFQIGWRTPPHKTHYPLFNPFRQLRVGHIGIGRDKYVQTGGFQPVKELFSAIRVHIYCKTAGFYYAADSEPTLLSVLKKPAQSGSFRLYYRKQFLTGDSWREGCLKPAVLYPEDAAYSTRIVPHSYFPEFTVCD